MVRKQSVKKSPGGKTRGSSVPKKGASGKKAVVKRSKTTRAAARKKVAKTGAGEGAGPGKKVRAEKKMISEMKLEKEAATMLEELQPADSTGKEKGHPREKKKKDKKRTRVKFKSVMLREEAISYFEAIIAGLKRGSIQIRQGDDAIVLKPTPQLDVVVKAASKDQDESIELEIRWRTASDSELTISTD